MAPNPSSDIASFRASLASAKSVIILSGAGLSAASGIPTYRNADNSLWNNWDPKLYAVPEAFKTDPVRVWKFYHRRRAEYLLARPNAAHRALALLAHAPTRARIVPSHTPLHITQNVDALALRALESLADGEGEGEDGAKADESLIEMHGDIFVTRCTQCGHVARSYAPVLSAALAALQDQDQDPQTPDQDQDQDPDGEAGAGAGAAITIDQLPKCGGEGAKSNRYGRCGGLLRPDVVWSGEMPPQMGEISRRMSGCDLLLLVGTSATVHPAAGFSSQVKKNGGKVAVFNLAGARTTVGEEEADWAFLGPCEETLVDVLGVEEDIARLWPDAGAYTN
ncbi:putative sir2 family protein [Lyophyllum shimeji]|uniref:Sir2 family protein n=1 Tax=Lyophyllum shimeji TaxID=47721 RepID=A0A9P3PL57_LYOSH|nr:putative sir2 family protein [Lyophyllum shimeji]